MTRFRSLLMCTCFALALAPVSAPMSAHAETALIYVTNAAGESVHVIDPVTNEVVQEIKNVEGAHGIAFSPDGARIYVAVEPTHSINVYDQKTGELIKMVHLSNRPNNLAVAGDGRIVVAIARGEGAMEIIDPVSLEVTKSIPVNGRLHNVYVMRLPARRARRSSLLSIWRPRRSPGSTNSIAASVRCRLKRTPTARPGVSIFNWAHMSGSRCSILRPKKRLRASRFPIRGASSMSIRAA
jgi:YVTN family beta-propeller protein